MNKNIIITILAVLVLGLGGYLVYDKVINNEEVSKENGVTNNITNDQNIQNNTQYETIDSNDTLIQDLYNSTRGHYYTAHGDPIYVTKYLSAENRSYEDKLCLVVQTSNNVYSEANIKRLYEKVHGINSYKRLENLNCPCTTYIFDSSKNEYKIDQDGCGFDGAYKESIVEARKYGDKIEIITTFYYVGMDPTTTNNRYCTDIYCHTVLSETHDFVEINAFEQYKNQLNKLTYTYKLDTNGSYYYYSTEINK